MYNAFSWIPTRRSQRDVVYLGWPIASANMSPKCGGVGGLRCLSQWVQYSYAHGAQTNSGDLTKCLTYDSNKNDLENVLKVLSTVRIPICCEQIWGSAFIPDPETVMDLDFEKSLSNYKCVRKEIFNESQSMAICGTHTFPEHFLLQGRMKSA